MTVRWRAALALAVVVPFGLPFIWLVASAFKPFDQFYGTNANRSNCTTLFSSFLMPGSAMP